MDLFDDNIFLESVRKNEVIPVIGSDLILVEFDHKIIPLYSYLTQKLGSKLKIDPKSLNFREFVLEYKEHTSLFDRAIRTVFQEILNENILITDHLSKLARITGFSFYISTTFDRIFESVLEKERGNKNQNIRILDYSFPLKAMGAEANPNEGNQELNVIKILGSLQSDMCAITDVEILEYIFSLKNEESMIRNMLFDQIKGKILLFLGCDFSNWLLRFFVRILANEPFVMCKTDKIIADNYAHKDPKISMFFSHFKTQIISFSDEEYKNPVVFINDFYGKWTEYYKNSIPKRYQGLVFLSYSHQDKEKIIPVRNEMLANGIDVWFDENKLESGDNYKQKINDQIRNCNLFIPFISQSSVLDPSSYAYSVEWDLAIARRKVRESDNDFNSFIHPVIIDDTLVTDEKIPLAFRQLTIQNLNINRLIERIKDQLNLITHDG